MMFNITDREEIVHHPLTGQCSLFCNFICFFITVNPDMGLHPDESDGKSSFNDGLQVTVTRDDQRVSIAVVLECSQ